MKAILGGFGFFSGGGIVSGGTVAMNKGGKLGA